MKMRRAIFVGGLLALFACMATPLSTPAAESAPAEAKGDASALRFRRIYLPEDRLDQWPRGDVRYLPLDATEFERMVARLQLGGQAVALPRRKSRGPLIPRDYRAIRSSRAKRRWKSARCSPHQRCSGSIPADWRSKHRAGRRVNRCQTPRVPARRL